MGSMTERPRTRSYGRTFDILIVGAGANGSAAAEELARAGFSVLLVDRSDFGSGTSSRSSRMLHCGFRSLEGAAGKSLWQHLTHLPDRWGLLMNAREQLAARADFVGVMPHRVRPVTMVMPLFRGGVGGFQMDAAAGLLALLGKRGIALDYRRFKVEDLGDLPFGEWLRRRNDLSGVVTFRDYVFDWPERICVDQALAAEQSGAEVRNYTSVDALRLLPEGGWSAVLHDRIADARATVTARLVLNLAGPWIDRVAGLASPQARQRTAPSKGVQIGVGLPARFQTHGLVAATGKGAFVCIPSQGLHLIGATSSKFVGDPADAAATDAEIDELLARTNELLPGIALDSSAVRFAVAGVRPGSLGSAGRIVHDHSADGLPEFISVTGGTVATSRQTAKLLSSMVAERIVATPRKEKVPARTASTAGDNYMRAIAVEHARTIADVLLRRTGEAWSADFDGRMVQDVAAALSAHNGGNENRTARAVADFRAELATLYRRDLGSVSSPQP